MTSQLAVHGKPFQEPFQGITLESLASQLGQWSPDDDNQLYAIVDMGSNGIRFSVTSLAPPTTRLLTPLFSTRAAKSLYSALEELPDNTKVFPSETITSVAAIIKRFASIAHEYHVPHSNFLVLGTAASRDAANAGELLAAITEATANQANIRILDPAVETLFGAVMGSRSCLSNVNQGGLFLDLGGGSVQMTWVDTSNPDYEFEAARYGLSLPFGAAKVIKVLDKGNKEQCQAEINDINAGVRGSISTLCSKFPKLQAAHEKGKDAPIDLYMCGGGFRGYGSMLQHMDPISPYPISSVNTYSVPGSFFRKTKEMGEENMKEGSIYGLSKSRRQQFPAILAVVEALIAAVPHIGRVTFCGGSNRQGLLMMKLPRSVRESDALQVLARVTEHEAPLFGAVISLIESALPAGIDADMPTLFNLGLGPLFVREIWSNMGYDSDANSSLALHSAVTRDPGCPGLTHLVRAMLGLAVCARWEASINPADAPLYKGLCGIADSHDEHASFWALFAGAVASVIALIFPLLPQPIELKKAMRFHTKLDTSHKKDKEKVMLDVDVDAKYLTAIDSQTLDKLTKKLESLLGKKGHRMSCKVTICKKSLSLKGLFPNAPS